MLIMTYGQGIALCIAMWISGGLFVIGIALIREGLNSR